MAVAALRRRLRGERRAAGSLRARAAGRGRRAASWSGVAVTPGRIREPSGSRRRGHPGRRGRPSLPTSLAQCLPVLRPDGHPRAVGAATEVGLVGGVCGDRRLAGPPWRPGGGGVRSAAGRGVVAVGVRGWLRPCRHGAAAGAGAPVGPGPSPVGTTAGRSASASVAAAGAGVRDRRRADRVLRGRHREARRDVERHLGPECRFAAPCVLLGRHTRVPGMGHRAWGRRAGLPPGHPAPFAGCAAGSRIPYGAVIPTSLPSHPSATTGPNSASCLSSVSVRG